MMASKRYTAEFRAEAVKQVIEQGYKVSEVASAPDQSWVTDIAYLRTAEGWRYLAIVIDLYSRAVIGWSMKPTLAKELAQDALLLAIGDAGRNPRW